MLIDCRTNLVWKHQFISHVFSLKRHSLLLFELLASPLFTSVAAGLCTMMFERPAAAGKNGDQARERLRGPAAIGGVRDAEIN